MTDKTQLDEDALEALFETARAEPPVMSDALMQRVLADAEAVQPGVKETRKGVFARIWEVLGGAPGMSGLATATCVGFWLGIAPPEGVPDVGGTLLGIEEITVAELDEGSLGGFGWDLDAGDFDG